MLRKIIKLVADCEGCRKRSAPFEAEERHRSDDRIEPFNYLGALPFGWGILRSSGWGMTDYTRNQLFCESCAEGLKEEGVPGEWTMSKKSPLDGLAEI